MIIQVLQENFAKAISTAARFTSIRAQLPVLGNILFKTQKTKLIVAATNLETSIAISLGAQVKKEGEITIPAKVLNDIVSNLQKGTIDLSVTGEKLKISANNFNSTVGGMNASDFPIIPFTKPKGMVLFESSAFSAAVSQVLFAASVDEARPVLTGVLAIFDQKLLKLVATDGFRLSQKNIVLGSKVAKKTMIIPKNILSEVIKLGSDDLGFVFRQKDNQVVFSDSSTVLSSRILEGEYPDFEKIIPKSPKMIIEIDKDDFQRAVKLASVFARESANMLKLKIAKEGVQILAESSNSGKQESLVEAKIDGLISNFEIAFNFRFLDEFLNSVKGESVQIALSDPNSPGLFTDPADKDYLHLIMPVKIQS